MKLTADEETVLRWLELTNREYDSIWDSPVMIAAGNLTEKGLLDDTIRCLTPAGERALEKLQGDAYNPTELLRLVEEAQKNLSDLAKEMLDNAPTSMAVFQRAEHRIIGAIKSYLSGDPSALEKLAGVE